MIDLKDSQAGKGLRERLVEMYRDELITSEAYEELKDLTLSELSEDAAHINALELGKSLVEEERIRRPLVEALKFYADEKIYQPTYTKSHLSNASIDRGEVARRAIEAAKEEKG